MTEAAGRICAPPGLEAPSDWDPPGGLDLPPGLPLPPSVGPAGYEAVCAPPGLGKAGAARGRGSHAGAGRAKAYSSCSTSAASVTTEEPPSEESRRCSAGGLLEEEAEEPHEPWPAYSATISGLPNKLLTEAMFEAVLEQASLSHLVLGFTLRAGKPCGEAKVSLISRMALEHCAQHFQGCQWDPSGAQVMVAVDIQECQENAEWELMAAAYSGGEGGLGGAAAAEALAFGAQPTAMSCEAPVFVPSAGLGAEDEAGGAQPAKPAALITSDTSTEVGESEAED